MKHIVVTVVAVVLLLAMYAHVGIIVLLLLVIPLGWLVSRFMEKREERKTAGLTKYNSIEEVTGLYGEPDDMVTLIASMGNELDALILFYSDKDVAVVAGIELKISELTGVTFKNLATPYTIDEWAVLVSTSNQACTIITLRVGFDAGLASEIAARISSHINKN